MKDISKEQWERTRPREDTLQVVTFCLTQLFKDEEHERTDEISDKLTYEEVIGALLKARDEIKESRKQNRRLNSNIYTG